VTRAGWWKAGGAAAFAVACAVVFAAYLRPDMLATFGDIMAFCASLIR
jgi:hypothetical protein